MKKFRTAFWLILAFLTLTSCGKKPSSESPSVTTSTDTTESETTTSVGDSGSEVTTFTITWKNYDSQVLEVDKNVERGTMPKYDGATPTRPDDDTYTYSFNGWDPEPVPVVADATYVAKYKTTLKEVVDPRDFVFADTGEGYTLCGYYGNASRVVIPETYNDKPVISLEKWAFFNLDNLVSVTLPNNLRKIGEDVFAECDNLKHVDFGNGVQEIGFMAFDHCPSLEAIALPDSVETIYGEAFANCPSLTSVRMSANIKTFGLGVFNKSPNVEYKVYENGLYLGNSTLSEYLVFVEIVDKTQTTLKLHPDTRLIAEFACYSSDVAEITSWGDNLRTINYGSFMRSKLTAITLPDTLEEIGDGAFKQTKLTSLKFGTGLKAIGYEAFSNCPDLADVTLPNSLEQIDSSVFYGTSVTYTDYENGRYLGSGGTGETANPYFALMEVITKTMTTFTVHADTHLIVPGVFYGSYSLESVEIKEKVSFIGSGAFENCIALTSLSVAANNTHFYSPSNKAILEKDTDRLLFGLNGGFIPEDTKIIGEKAFYYRKFTEPLVIPSSVTTIEDYAFYQTNLTAIVIPDSVTKIGKSVFQYSNSLTSVTLSKNLKVIEDWTFSGCKILETLTIPDSVTMIKEWAFSNCEMLANVTYSANLAFIGDVAFSSCVALTTLPASESLRVFGSGSFRGCESLTSITIPKIVRYISSGAFADCTALTTLNVVSENNHYDSRENCNGIIETATNTLMVAVKDTVIVESIEALGAEVFSGIDIQSITIPASITKIGNWAFSDCGKLETVVIEGELTTINAGTFSHCTSLTSVNIPETVTEIGGSAFYNCKVLPEIKLPANLEKIGSWCFGRCTILPQIVIPRSVTNIARSAFSSCANLTIYAEATALPDGWHADWNDGNRPVYWYSETANYDGSHWRYVDGVPTVWAE